jgi:hypothetical protein
MSAVINTAQVYAHTTHRTHYLDKMTAMATRVVLAIRVLACACTHPLTHGSVSKCSWTKLITKYTIRALLQNRPFPNLGNMTCVPATACSWVTRTSCKQFSHICKSILTIKKKSHRPHHARRWRTTATFSPKCSCCSS